MAIIKQTQTTFIMIVDNISRRLPPTISESAIYRHQKANACRMVRVVAVRCLEEIVELVPCVNIVAVVANNRVTGNESVLGADVEAVVDLPVDVAHFTSGVEQALQHVLQNLPEEMKLIQARWISGREKV